MKEIINKGKFIEALSEEKLKAGYIKFNIPDEDNPSSNGGEGVWGWCTDDDKAKYNDDDYHGNITAILLNQPINYCGKLSWGDEVILRCQGENRPTIDSDWIREHLF